MKTDWKEDILAPSMDGKRRYHIYENEDASISLIDSTEYDQVGDVFGATELNQIGVEINTAVDMLTDAVQSAQASAESAQASADRASQFTPEGYQNFVNSTNEHLSTLLNPSPQSMRIIYDALLVDLHNADSDMNKPAFVHHTAINKPNDGIYSGFRNVYYQDDGYLIVTLVAFTTDDNISFWMNSHNANTSSGWVGWRELRYADNNDFKRVNVNGDGNSVNLFSDGEGGTIEQYNNASNRCVHHDMLNGDYRVYLFEPEPWNYLNDLILTENGVYTNNKIYVKNGTSEYKEVATVSPMITGTLSAGSTSITLTDSRITTDSVFRFFTSKFGVSPTACTVNNGAVILTFEAQSEPITVGVKVE